MSNLENTNHVYACIYEWDYLGLCTRGSDCDRESASKFPGKTCSATAGHKVRVRMTGKSEISLGCDYLEWI